MQIGPWRATYSPGRWVLLAGPTAVAVLQPAGPRHSRLIASIWEEILASADIHAVAQVLSRFGLDQMPSLAVLFWSGDGMRSLVRGEVRIVDPTDGRVVADGAEVQTWSETGLGALRQVSIEVGDDPADDALELPLVVGGAQVSRVLLDARPVSSVQEAGDALPPVASPGGADVPAESPGGADVSAEASDGDLGAAAAAAATPAVAGFASSVEVGDRPDQQQPEDRMDPTEPLAAADVPRPLGEETPFDDDDDGDQSSEQNTDQSTDQEADHRSHQRNDQPAEHAEHFDQHDGAGSGMVSEVAATSGNGDERPVPAGDEAGEGPSTEDYEAMDFEETPAVEETPDGEETPGVEKAPDPDASVAPAVQPSLENDTEVMPAVGTVGPVRSTPGFTPPAAPQQPYAPPQAVPGTEPAGLVEAAPGQTQQVSNHAQPLPIVAPPDETPPHEAPSQEAPPQEAPRVLGILRPSNGAPVPLDRPVVMGRAPRPQPGLADPALMPLQSPSHDISRTHAQVVPDGDEVRVTDLHSTNGTILIRDGGSRRERLTPGDAVLVSISDVIDVGDGVTITLDPPQ